jgi:hypothetical protein
MAGSGSGSVRVDLEVVKKGKDVTITAREDMPLEKLGR